MFHSRSVGTVSRYNQLHELSSYLGGSRTSKLASVEGGYEIVVAERMGML
jgi:hypothetical protein